MKSHRIQYHTISQSKITSYAYKKTLFHMPKYFFTDLKRDVLKK